MRTLTILSLLSFILCGCSSIAARKPAYPEADHCYPSVFPGVRHDAHNIADPELPAFSKTILVLDYPISTVVDVLLLPYDWPHSAHHDSP
jgi:uncharacterized protein YceK